MLEFSSSAELLESLSHFLSLYFGISSDIHGAKCKCHPPPTAALMERRNTASNCSIWPKQQQKKGSFFLCTVSLTLWWNPTLTLCFGERQLDYLVFWLKHHLARCTISQEENKCVRLTLLHDEITSDWITSKLVPPFKTSLISSDWISSFQNIFILFFICWWKCR